MDFMIIFKYYDVTSEVLMLVVALIMLAIMAISAPKKTRMLYLNVFSFITAVVTIAVHLWILYFTCVPEKFSDTVFKILYTIYCLLYITILNEITTYIDLLSYKRRNNVSKTLLKIGIQTAIYLLMLMVPIYTDRMYIVKESGAIVLTGFTYMIDLAGIICALVAFFSCLIKLKSLAKIVAMGTMLFIPMDIFVFMFQFSFPTVYFTSFTYVIPFIIFYCLFHGNKYDDVIGCQHTEAIITPISHAMLSRRPYVLIDVTFPQLRKREFSELRPIIEDVSSHMCRKIERFTRSAKIFSENVYTYTMFSYVKSEEEAKKLSDSITKIVEEPFVHEGVAYQAAYKQAVIYCDSYLKKAEDALSLIGFIRRKFNNDFENQTYFCTKEDIERFNLANKIEEAVIDIRAKGNLDDERVLTFIQPIHLISQNAFRTGESLMRLKLNGEVFYPDLFIDIAERNNCIHSLTLIMLNKVCKKIRELEEASATFEGITVNCSTMELADTNFHNEVMKIVEANGINPSHLKIEITESTTIDKYDNILYNMNCLTEKGIGFYLDDFGTGYSNFERIMKFPFKTIKFDKSILYSALVDSKADAFVRMQVQFFTSNGFTTVVEGVEDEQQYNYCKEVGFGMIQGYYFSKPQPAEEILKYFK